MNASLKLWIYLLLLTSIPLRAFSNAAQPGFWDAGGTGTFSLLFPEDSAAYKKIQMVKEKVSIQLYKGYAVVKGEYWMYNDTPEAISLKAGYPLNSSYMSSNTGSRYDQRKEILFEELYGLKVSINNHPVVYNREYKESADRYYPSNWYVWQNSFTPKDTTKITVYFLVNTNHTRRRDGYSTDNANGFLYILETGATWKQPILQGEVRIQLMDELEMDDVEGIAPDSIFRIDENAKLIYTAFKNLSPSYQNNIIIAYAEKVEEFNFQQILKQQTELYKTIDRFSDSVISPGHLTSHTFDDPFDVPGGLSGLFLGIVMVFAFFLPFWIGLGVLVLIIVVLVKVFRKKKNN